MITSDNLKSKANTALAFIDKHFDKTVIMFAFMFMILVAPAHAEIDVSGVVDEIKELKEPINKIGTAILGIAVVIFGWRLVRSVIR